MRRQLQLLIDSLLLGIVGGLSAQLFTWLLKVFTNLFQKTIAGYTPPGLPEEGGEIFPDHGRRTCRGRFNINSFAS